MSSNQTDEVQQRLYKRERKPKKTILSNSYMVYPCSVYRLDMMGSSYNKKSTKKINVWPIILLKLQHVWFINKKYG